MSDYQKLLEQAKANPAEVDFLALRMAYAELPGMMPYLRDIHADRVIKQAFATHNYLPGIEAAQQILAKFFLDIEIHFVAAALCDLQGDSEKSAYHRTIGDGLLRSIIDFGDGRSFESSFIVVDLSEEYAVMRLLGFQPQMQRRVPRGEHLYNIFDVLHLRTRQTGQMYFNTDLTFFGKGHRQTVAAVNMPQESDSVPEQTGEDHLPDEDSLD